MKNILNQISIILVSYNSASKLKKFIKKIPKETNILIIDKNWVKTFLLTIGDAGKIRVFKFVKFSKNLKPLLSHKIFTLCNKLIYHCSRMDGEEQYSSRFAGSWTTFCDT